MKKEDNIVYMDKNTFYELIDIETPEDFKFYDNIENLIEADEEWDIDLLSPLLIEIPNDVIIDLLDEYFKSLLDRLPDDETDLYTLIYNVGRTMKAVVNTDGVREVSDKEPVYFNGENSADTKRRLAYELKKFSDWFSRNNLVDIKNLENGRECKAPLRDVLGLITLEKLGMGSYSYNFDNCNDYELDEYILNFADLAGTEEIDNMEDNVER